MSTLSKELKDLTYIELKALLDTKKETELAALYKELNAAKLTLSTIEGKIAEITGASATVAVAAPAPAKRGRKPKSSLTPVIAKPAKVKAGKRARRGQLGENIVKYLQGKGAAGAHVKDIAAKLKTKTANVTAWFYTTGKKLSKKVKPATFALAPKA